MESAVDLIQLLNTTDETSRIEAKQGRAIDRSVLETVCAFSNEPRLGGGNILLGVKREENSLFPNYETINLQNLDKLQLDLSTQCASMFNLPVRPEINVETIGKHQVLNIFIPEVADSAKPVFFKNEGLPRGAFRRIGTSDQRCSEEDLLLFYGTSETFDSSIVKDSSLDDVDENALERYRTLRLRVNPYAEELNYNDRDLLQALGAVKKQDDIWSLTYTGLLIFGKSVAQRRLIPAVRVDYIRVPGNEWVSDPENRFTTIDMRGPLLLLVERAYSAIVDDLPKGFLLQEGQIQAESVGLPGKALREALVNALMHRSYRVHQPVQIIRYANRLEIRNPGFSLKQTDELGTPGSQIRNQFISAIFHETNLAETKGSGIATMRKLMNAAQMAPPVFESDHANNQFTARLLLHHFLSESDLSWLNDFKQYNLNDDQKKALILVREMGAIDNPTYRQLSACDTLKASADLRNLRDLDLLQAKGQSRATYYIAGDALTPLSEPVSPLKEKLSEIPQEAGSQLNKSLSAPPEPLLNQLPPYLTTLVNQLGLRTKNEEDVKTVIVALCKWKPLKLSELAIILHRGDKYLLYNFVKPMREAGILAYTIPEMPNHPEQAYTTNANNNNIE